jgi:hypothetical protein
MSRPCQLVTIWPILDLSAGIADSFGGGNGAGVVVLAGGELAHGAGGHGEEAGPVGGGHRDTSGVNPS